MEEKKEQNRKKRNENLKERMREKEKEEQNGRRKREEGRVVIKGAESTSITFRSSVAQQEEERGRTRNLFLLQFNHRFPFSSSIFFLHTLTPSIFRTVSLFHSFPSLSIQFPSGSSPLKECVYIFYSFVLHLKCKTKEEDKRKEEKEKKKI